MFLSLCKNHSRGIEVEAIQMVDLMYRVEDSDQLYVAVWIQGHGNPWIYPRDSYEGVRIANWWRNQYKYEDDKNHVQQ